MAGSAARRSRTGSRWTPSSLHQRDVLGVAVVVVARLRARRAVDDRAGLGGEGVPDARALAVAADGALDLVRRSAGAEPEARREPGHAVEAREFPHGHNLSCGRGDPPGNRPIRRPGRRAADARTPSRSARRTTPTTCGSARWSATTTTCCATARASPPTGTADLEIVTWVLSGALAARPTRPARGRVEPGRGRRCSAPAPASTHAEVAAAPQTRFVQVWLTPRRARREPSYDVATPDAADRRAGPRRPSPSRAPVPLGGPARRPTRPSPSPPAPQHPRLRRPRRAAALLARRAAARRRRVPVHRRAGARPDRRRRRPSCWSGRSARTAQRSGTSPWRIAKRLAAARLLTPILV